MKLRVSGAQIPITNNISNNVDAINRAISFAISEKADILLTPEGSLSGYTNAFSQVETETALKDIVSRASENRLGMALGTCFYEQDGLCYNQIRFYDADGSYLGCHSKTLVCGTPTDPSKGEHEYYAVKPLEVFRFKGITIGGLVCNDLWANPEWTPMPDTHLAQQLSRMGAKVIFHAVNCGYMTDEFSQVIESFHESNLQLRARAGKLWVVTVNSCYSSNLPGMSPIGVVAPDGNWVKRVHSSGEHYFVQTIELD